MRLYLAETVGWRFAGKFKPPFHFYPRNKKTRCTALNRTANHKAGGEGHIRNQIAKITSGDTFVSPLLYPRTVG